MKTSAVLSLIVVVGAAATAGAQPGSPEPSGRVRYTDKDAAAPLPALPKEGEQIELATPTPASHGTEFVMVGKEAGAFSKLRIAAASGRVIVRKVRIFFANGATKTVQVDSILDARRGKDATIDLGGVKVIDHVTVATEPGRGTYTVYGIAGR